MFTATRAVFIGLLGVLAVLLGTAFIGFQKGAWIVLGALYATIGVLYVFGGARFLNASFGPGLARLSGVTGSVGLGLLFGFNVPACAAPLIFRSEEHTSELQSLMRISSAVFCLKKKQK